MNIILTGGFTGGHIVPLIRLKEKYQKKYNFFYVGFNGYLEETLASKSKIPFLGLKKEESTIKIIFNKKYNVDIKKYFHDKKIDLVISSGGIHSYPMINYARRHKIKYILIEENSKIGYLNLLYKKRAFKFITNFKINDNYLLLPNPSIYYRCGNVKCEYDFLFLGGSLGSKVLNDMAIKLANKGYKVLLIAGRYVKDYKYYESENLKILGFVDLRYYYRVAKIVVTRAGSSTLFELLKANVAFVIIPSLKTKRNHQVKNALEFKKKKLALTFDEKTVTCNDFIKLLSIDFSRMLERQRQYLEQFEDDIYEKIIESSR